jgi:hypothetical protein
VSGVEDAERAGTELADILIRKGAKRILHVSY